MTRIDTERRERGEERERYRESKQTALQCSTRSLLPLHCIACVVCVFVFFTNVDGAPTAAAEWSRNRVRIRDNCTKECKRMKEVREA